jgi:uncharacterized protein
MLLVRTTVGPSTIHGLGVFAAEPIAKGTVVWSFTPGFDLERDLADVETLPELLRERLLHYGYMDKHLGLYVLCCDDARFLNHSDEPNLVTDRSHSRHGVDRAAHDIAIGEELTVNYDAFESTRQVR